MLVATTPVKTHRGVLVDRLDIVIDLHDLDFEFTVLVRPTFHDPGLVDVTSTNPGHRRCSSAILKVSRSWRTQKGA